MPGGAPHRLDDVVHQRGGQPVTASEVVLERIRLGLEYQEAADTANISRQTLHTWRLNGARARAAAARGEKLTANQQRYARFLDDVERAHAQAHLERLAVIQRATQPLQLVKTVERAEVQPDGTMKVVERTTTTETRPGQWTAAAWWLERRMPARYGKRVEVTGPEGGPIALEERASTLAGQLAAYLAGNNDATAVQADQ